METIMKKSCNAVLILFVWHSPDDTTDCKQFKAIAIACPS